MILEFLLLPFGLKPLTLFLFYGFNRSFIFSSTSSHLFSPCLSNTGYNLVRGLAACGLVVTMSIMS